MPWSLRCRSSCDKEKGLSIPLRLHRVNLTGSLDANCHRETLTAYEDLLISLGEAKDLGWFECPLLIMLQKTTLFMPYTWVRASARFWSLTARGYDALSRSETSKSLAPKSRITKSGVWERTKEKSKLSGWHVWLMFRPGIPLTMTKWAELLMLNNWEQSKLSASPGWMFMMLFSLNCSASICKQNYDAKWEQK